MRLIKTTYSTILMNITKNKRKPKKIPYIGWRWNIQISDHIQKKNSSTNVKPTKSSLRNGGLTIEERELRQFERVKLLHKAWKNNGITPEHKEVSTLWVEYKNLMEKYSIPTKLITIKYNDKTIESYE
jgi:hypothetical protein